MPVIEKDKTTQVQDEQRFIPAPRDIETAPTPTRLPALVLISGLVVAAMLIVGIVLAAGGGGASNGTAGKGSAKPAGTPAATQKAATSAPVPSATIAVTLKEFTIAPAPSIGRAGRV